MSTTIRQHGNWRIEFDFDRPGAHHMERDESLARDYAGNVLRLYTWNPAALSLGFQQKLDSIDLVAAERLGVDVVRRPTGGRAVLHWNEVTYAVIVRTVEGQGIYAAHNAIIGALLRSMEQLGEGFAELTLTTGNSDAGFREVYKPGTLTNAACFASTARHEVTWRGRKVIGSAQRRFGNVVLQHGSILLTEDHLHLPELLRLDEPDQLRMHTLLKRETATLSDVFTRSVSASEVAGAISNGFCDAYSEWTLSTPISPRLIL